MRIAFGFYGFLNTLFSPQEIYESLRKSLPKDSIIDIFYFCPSILREIEKTPLNKNDIEQSFKDSKLGNVYFKWYDYDPFFFIDQVEKLNLPMKSPTTKMYPYRLFSTYFHMSNTVQLIRDTIESESLVYDVVILSRNDYLKAIEYYTDIHNHIPLKNGIYVLRNDMFPTNENVIFEDRVVYGTPEYMLQLNSVFSELPKILTSDDTLYNEYIMREFLLRRFSPEFLYFQNGIQPLKPISLHLEFKRTDQCFNMVQELYNAFKNLR